MARLILGILIIVVLVAIAAVTTGFIDVNTTGRFKAPAVAVTGGELPQVDVDTKKVVLEAQQKTVEVPKIETGTANIEVPVVRTEERR
ncbi:MAG TPA: hypothetical protein VJM13_09095 [Sphingopyxis sp.]|nr:hypothetical protein [Allosphingosinicella sp.]HKX89352.1 hypothetical protein [Sphingopyxis sp.]